MINKKLTTLSISVLSALVMPMVAMAGNPTVGSLACSIQNLVVLLFGVIAVIYFLWYGIMFLIARGDPAKTEVARMGVIYGVVGVVVGGLAFVVVQMIASFFGITISVFTCP